VYTDVNLYQGLSCPTNSNFGGGEAVNTTGKNLTAAGYIIVDALVQTGVDFSEDCLTINVWTKPQVGEKKKAVLVWLYGGGFTSGTSADPMYDGEHIVDQEDVVFVSFKYVFPSAFLKY
jgi:cholinesterase